MQFKARGHGAPHRKTSARPINQLASAVKDARVLQGMTQQELAERSGISIFFIRKFEQGSRSIRLDKLYVILEFLGLDLLVLPRGTRP